MFIGGVDTNVLKCIHPIIKQFKTVYCGCSGNFNNERICVDLDVKDIYSNDINVYTCALGAYFTREPFRFEIIDDEYDWLREFNNDALDAAIISDFLMEYLKFGQNYYGDNMRLSLKTNFIKNYKKYRESFEGKAVKLKLINSYYSGDVYDFEAERTKDSLFISFFPTYVGGYEKLYKKVNEIISWDNPDYVLFDEDRLESLISKIVKKGNFIFYFDELKEDMEQYLFAKINKKGMKDIYLYTDVKTNKRFIDNSGARKATNFERYENQEITKTSKFSFKQVIRAEFDYYRGLYLKKGMVEGGADFYYFVFVDGRVFGFFSVKDLKQPDNLFIVSDFILKQTKYKKLSKLLIMLLKTKEIKLILEKLYIKDVSNLTTMIFTDKNKSMKCKGQWDLDERIIKESKIRYKTNLDKTIKQMRAEWIQRYRN